MTANMDTFHELLAKMRAEFLAELPDRCDALDDLILQLEKFPGDRDAFNELYRAVHSLKGSGGTHGLSMITTICHQLENHLTETDSNDVFGRKFATRALSYVDLLRRVEELAQQVNPNYADIEHDLEVLRQSGLHSRKAGLVVESSPMMSKFYQQALAELPLQLTAVDSGMTALERLLHEPFDFVIVGREAKDLNGIALMAAVRAAQARNQNIPAILISSKLDAIPAHAGFKAAILRDQNLADNLIAAVRGMLKD
jgi:HPt (histidine-containing phosphotransfer) domain-containing protein/CheY-like chemotaxis protein